MDLSKFTDQELQELKQANETGKLDGVSQNTLLKMKAANDSQTSQNLGQMAGGQSIAKPDVTMMDKLKNSAGRALLGSIPPLGAAQMYDDVKAGMTNGFTEDPNNTPPDYGRIGATARSFGHGAMGPIYDAALAGTKYAGDAIDPSKDANLLQALQAVSQERSDDRMNYPMVSGGAELAGLMMPGGVASKTMSGASKTFSNPYAANILGGVATGQMQSDITATPQERGMAALGDSIAGTALTGISQLLQKATPTIKRWGENSVMSWLKTRDRKLADELLKENIAPSLTMDSALKKMALKSQEATAKINEMLPKAPEGAKIDMKQIVENNAHIKKMLNAAKERNDVTTIRAIKNLLYKDTVVDGETITGIANKGFLSPQEADSVKRSLQSDSFRPNGTPIDSQLEEARRVLAHDVSEAIDSYVPGYRALNRTQKTAIDLMKSAKVFDNVGATGGPSNTDIAALLWGGTPEAATYIAGKRLIKSTAFKTGKAGLMNKTNKVLENGGAMQIGNQLTKILSGSKPPENAPNSQQAE